MSVVTHPGFCHPRDVKTYLLMVFPSCGYRSLFVVLAALILMTEHGIAQGSAIPDGEALYMTRCSSCHQANGEGISGVFPPLNEIDRVTGDKGQLIRIVLDGVMGPLQVGNTVYTGAMPPWKTYLDDREMAALLSYIRTAWDNDASTVTESEVRLVREATSGRNEAWTYPSEQPPYKLSGGIRWYGGFVPS